MVVKVGFGFNDRPTLPTQIKLAPLLEKLGYSSIWIVESRMVRDAVTVASAMALSTNHIAVGMVVNSWTRGPALLGLTLSTLNELAPKRISVALTDYWQELAWKQGIDRARPTEQLREYVLALRSILDATRPTTFEGTQVQIRDLQLDLGRGVPREVIPVQIYVVAATIEVSRLAGEIGDGVLLNSLSTTEFSRLAASAVRAGVARAVGTQRGRETLQLVSVAMAVDRSDAVRAGQRKAALYIGQQSHIAAASGLSDHRTAEIRDAIGSGPIDDAALDAAAHLVDEDTLNGLMIVGTPDECRDAAARWIESGRALPVFVPVTDNSVEIAEVLAPASLGSVLAGRRRHGRVPDARTARVQ